MQSEFNIQVPSEGTYSVGYMNIEPKFLDFLSSQGVHSLELKPDEKNIFFQGKAKSSSLFLRCDGIIAYFVLVDKSWDEKKIQFFIKSLDGKNTSQVDVIDIGANIGLISRQLLCVADSSISKIYCYEPNKDNYDILEKNLSYSSKVITNNFALGSKNEVRELFLDNTNCGNYSLLKEAVPSEDIRSKTTVDVQSVEDQLDEWSKSENQIFWKSDTQGMDEKIATLLPLEFWNDKIYAASLELWKIPGKDFDLDLFEKIIDIFPIKTFDSNPNELLDTKDVLNYITNTTLDYNYKDLNLLKVA
tara:strand:+ start:354 stop:1262 length:909 start_codon:yes stop_codon:yes gene_type:complete